MIDMIGIVPLAAVFILLLPCFAFSSNGCAVAFVLSHVFA